jgi:hypothetical protein
VVSTKVKGSHADAYMKMARRVHRIPPLRRDDSNRVEVHLDLTGSHVGSEGRLVDQKRFVLDRSIRRQAMSCDVVGEDPQVFERCKFCWHRRSL